MNAHVTAWLAAYYDGELPDFQLQQVEEHLGGCPTCRAEFEQLNKLSQLLLKAPSPVRGLSAQRFQAQVKLRLPPKVPQPGWQSALKAGWRFAPLAAVFVWVFAQAALLIASLASVIELPFGLSRLGMLNEWLNLAGSSLNLGGAETVIELSLLNLVFTALVAVFLCGWIASWWVFRRHSQKDTNLLAA